MIEGEGIGWLKLNRVRKLMEDETYRMLVVSGLNRTLDRKIGPDDHIDDVVSCVLTTSFLVFTVKVFTVCCVLKGL